MEIAFLKSRFFVSACALAIALGIVPLQALAEAPRAELKLVQLNSEWLPDAPLDTHVFAPPPSGRPHHKFPGRLVLIPTPDRARMAVVRDSRNRLQGREDIIATLPPMNIVLAQSGRDLVPAERGLVSGSHPYWEYFVGVGQAWDEPGDLNWSRASIPFALQERNQNCTYNGVLSFLFKSDGSVSNVYYQVSSETCTYLQLDLWGTAAATVSGHESDLADGVVADYRTEQRLRLPVKPIATLSDDVPSADPSQFQPPGLEDLTVYGLVVDGTHYVGGCQTRHGPFPFCAELHLPSYSTSKSVFAGFAWMRMRKLWPDIINARVSDLVPECDLPDGRWNDVSLDDLLDMTSGNYTSAAYMNDEDDLVWNFLNPETHAQKVKNACEQHPRSGTPGGQWVYHTSDTYLLVTALDKFLSQKRGGDQDAYADLVVSDLWMGLGLSPVTHTSLRTFDTVQQTFGGLGLTYLPDDIARIGQFMGRDDGRINGQAMFAADELDFALFRGQGVNAEHKATALYGYSNGVWGAPGHSWLNCPNLTFIPHFSGYGGITVALFPNGMVYYIFSDSGLFQWTSAAREANRLEPFCR